MHLKIETHQKEKDNKKATAKKSTNSESNKNF